MAIDDFAETKPNFIPEQFLVGHLEGWAVFENLLGGLNGGRRLLGSAPLGYPEGDFY